MNVFEVCSNADKIIYLDGDHVKQVYYNALYNGNAVILENEYESIDKQYIFTIIENISKSYIRVVK